MNFTECNRLNLKQAAERYRAAGLKITPLRPQTKQAYKDNWQAPESADKYTAEYWQFFPADNIGLLLNGSGIVSLDIDDLDAFLLAMKSLGFTEGPDGQPPFYRTATAGIKSGATNHETGHKKGKLIFEKPDGPAGERLAYHKLNWKDANGKSYTVFELRTGKAGADIQDVLPPSIHPDTGKPYQWIGGDILPLPEDLFILWAEWSLFEPELIRADPNYIPEPLKIKRPTRAPKNGEKSATQIIELWNEGQDIAADLEKYGYKHAYGNRYLSPHSTSGNPGIIINTADNSAFNHGESDPLGTEHKIKPFDLLLYYEYGGDLAAAVKFIKSELGLSEPEPQERKTRRNHPHAKTKEAAPAEPTGPTSAGSIEHPAAEPATPRG